MTNPLHLGLNSGTPATYDEAWVTPDQIARVGNLINLDETIDLWQICNFATVVLYRLSGRRYGVRTETDRPIAGQASCGWGSWAQSGAGNSTMLWRFQRQELGPEWVLLKAPVQAITAVKVDGVALDPSEYSLFDQRKLVRLPNPSNNNRLSWPLSQSLQLADTEPGTFSITYQWGIPVPSDAKLAARVFAAELVKYVNDEPTALMDRVVSVTRQGVSKTIMEPSQFLSKGRTGLFLVDTWLAAVNPNGSRLRPSVMSPDTIQNARVT